MEFRREPLGALRSAAARNREAPSAAPQPVRGLRSSVRVWMSSPCFPPRSLFVAYNEYISRSDGVNTDSARLPRAEHLPGAINLPLKELDAKAARALDRSRPVVTYCNDFT